MMRRRSVGLVVQQILGAAAATKLRRKVGDEAQRGREQYHELLETVLCDGELASRLLRLLR